MQDGMKIPKWDKRAKRGQFLGFSKRHSKTVGLIRNLTTGSVSPQYHVIHDDLFQTVLNPIQGTSSKGPELGPEDYKNIVTAGIECYLDDEYDEKGEKLKPPELSKEWRYLDDSKEKGNTS